MLSSDNLGNTRLEDGAYKYQGAELTPQVFADILVELFDGKQFSRKEAVDAVLNYHLTNNGLSHLDSYEPTFKKACSKYLADSLRNVSYGVWELKYEQESVEPRVSITTYPEQTIENTFSIDQTLGEGSETVYVYYYDAYQELSALKSEATWPCKVGLTDGIAQKRILDQSGTAYPEYPHIALAISTDNCRDLEAALHAVLKVRRRWIRNAPGTKWFITTPEEVAEINKTIMQEG